MKVYIQILRSPAALRKTLEAAGWRLESAPEGAVHARHPHLHDEADVRDQLNDLGLLTSSAVRIEFCPSAAKDSNPSA
jgi:hypothetical protein